MLYIHIYSITSTPRMCNKPLKEVGVRPTKLYTHTYRHCSLQQHYYYNCNKSRKKSARKKIENKQPLTLKGSWLFCHLPLRSIDFVAPNDAYFSCQINFLEWPFFLFRVYSNFIHYATSPQLYTSY